MKIDKRSFKKGWMMNEEELEWNTIKKMAEEWTYWVQGVSIEIIRGKMKGIVCDNLGRDT